MDYLDDMKLKMMKNLNEISATFVVYNSILGVYATKLTGIHTLVAIWRFNGRQYVSGN